MLFQLLFGIYYTRAFYCQLLTNKLQSFPPTVYNYIINLEIPYFYGNSCLIITFRLEIIPSQVNLVHTLKLCFSNTHLCLSPS
jgi:hypothetical protein